ncbi:MAG: hypothetical protein ACTH5C_07290 [Pseudoalteromonas prydzensis]|uniref:hypothetical protein n=1 Tax=Pseudoalteromonas prydzensis TaxID=182141 RepID=UPI003F9E5DB1
MNKFGLWFVTLISFLFFIVALYAVASYLLLSLPLFNKAVLPDAGTLIVAAISAIVSIFLSVYFSRKLYLRLAVK